MEQVAVIISGRSARLRSAAVEAELGFPFPTIFYRGEFMKKGEFMNSKHTVQVLLAEIVGILERMKFQLQERDLINVRIDDTLNNMFEIEKLQDLVADVSPHLFMFKGVLDLLEDSGHFSEQSRESRLMHWIRGFLMFAVRTLHLALLSVRYMHSIWEKQVSY